MTESTISDAESHARTSRAPRRFWGQFSLVTLLLLAVIAALAAGYYASARRLNEAQQQLQQAKDAISLREQEMEDLRAKLEWLEIADPKRVHIRECTTAGFMHWKWRIYLPKGREWQLGWFVGTLPMGGAAQVATRIRLPAREFTLELRIECTLLGHIYCYVNVHDPDGGGAAFPLDQELAELLVYGQRETPFTAGMFGPLVTEPLQKQDVLEYFVRRPYAVSGADMDDPPRDDPTVNTEFGIRLWLESEVKAPAKIAR